VIRYQALAAGGGLIVLAIVVVAALGAAATVLAGSLGLGGVVLVIYGIAGDALESFGPQGGRFRDLRDRAAEIDPQTATAVSGVRSPEGLVDVLLTEIADRDQQIEALKGHLIGHNEQIGQLEYDQEQTAAQLRRLDSHEGDRASEAREATRRRLGSVRHD
jgi:hypothetical protein